MYPVERALWFIENRLAGEISLQAIAASVGVSSTIWRERSGRQPDNR